MSKNRMPKQPSTEECRQSVIDFYEKQTRFKDAKSEFDDDKDKFNSLMTRFFESEALDKSVVFANHSVYGEERYTVTRVQKMSVDFDLEKLEEVLPKDIAKRAILKKYEVIDMQGLIAYLKECDVDPKIFKSFLHITKSIDSDELDRLEELGKISMEQVEGCYTVKRQKPYFTVSVKRGHDDGETNTKW